MKKIINLANEIYFLDKNKKSAIKKAIKYLKDIDYEEFEKFKELKYYQNIKNISYKK